MLERNTQGTMTYRRKVIEDWSSFLTTLQRVHNYEFPRPEAWSDRSDDLLDAASTEPDLPKSRELFRKGMEARYLLQENLYIEQGFSVFSDRTTLQVEGLCSCIYLIICDPNSHFCAGMHLDNHIAKAGIERMIEQFLSQLPTAIPQNQHKNYPLKVHMMGGNTSSFETAQTIYTVLSQYTIELDILHMTLETDYPKSRPLNIAFNPISQQFYGAMVPFSNPIKKDSAIYVKLYYKIHPITECQLLKYNNSNPLTIQGIKKHLTHYPNVILYKNALYTLHQEENSIEKLQKDDLFESDFEEILNSLQALQDDNSRMATPEELRFISTFLFQKRDMHLAASDKQGVLQTFPIVHPEEAMQRLIRFNTQDDIRVCDGFYLDNIRAQRTSNYHRLYYDNLTHHYSNLYLQRPYPLLATSDYKTVLRGFLNHCFFSGRPEDKTEAIEAIPRIVEEYLG